MPGKHFIKAIEIKKSLIKYNNIAAAEEKLLGLPQNQWPDTNIVAVGETLLHFGSTTKILLLL